MRISVSLVVAFIFSVSGSKGATKRPHIVFVLADDLGWNDVSFHGSLQIPTPNIDLLAFNGIVLNNYYVQHMCTPSRASLLTGKHPIHLGLQHWVLVPFHNAGLPLNVKLLPEYLRELGYATHAVGKWHLGFHKKQYTPTYRGFDSFLGTWLPFIDYYDHTYFKLLDGDPEKLLWGRALRDGMEPTDKYLGKYATNLFTDKAVNIIKNHNASQPLFLYVAHVAVHTGNSYRPLQAPLKDLRRMNHIKDNDRQTFAGMVSSLDKSVGNILRALEKKGMLDDVIFIFSTDNGGEASCFQSGAGCNWPLRGSKSTLWEAGIRGTAFVWSRLLNRTRRISNQLFHISDWFTTLYNAAGGNMNNLGDVYGVNLWESLSNGLSSQRNEILHNIDPIEKASALRVGKYKLVMGSNSKVNCNNWYSSTTRNNEVSPSTYNKRLQNCSVWKILKRQGWLRRITEDWKSQLRIQCASNCTSICDPALAPCLFNVDVDPCEQRNLANERPQILKAMLHRLERYNATAVPVFNQTFDFRVDPFLHSFRWTNWAQDLL